MKNVFKVTPSVAFFATPRSGSTALVGAILEKYHPDLKIMADNAHAPEGHRGMPQGVAPRLKDYNGETIVFPVRDPVERFRSAFAFRQRLCDNTGKETVDEVLDIIGAQDPQAVDPHFRLQNVFFKELQAEAREIQVFQFPRDLSELAVALTLDATPTPDHVSETKPDLTPTQIARVQEIYADDIALYESITEAGQVWTKPPTPATDVDKAEKLAELAAARYAEEMGGIEVDGILIKTDERTRSILTASMVEVRDNPVFSLLNWKLSDGNFVDLSALQILSICEAVNAHIAATFAKERTLSEQVTNATTIAELEAIKW